VYKDWSLDKPFRESSTTWHLDGTRTVETTNHSWGEYPTIYFHINDRKPPEGRIVYVNTFEFFRGSRCLKNTTTACWQDGKWFYEHRRTHKWVEAKGKKPWFTHWKWNKDYFKEYQWWKPYKEYFRDCKWRIR